MWDLARLRQLVCRRAARTGKLTQCVSCGTLPVTPISGMVAGKIRTIGGDSNTGGRMDIKANKDLGQNFLFDDAVLHQIADYAALTPADHVLEIGPGLGTLTTKLCDKAGQVTAVEFDQRLADSLLDNIAKWRLEFDDLKVSPKKCDSGKPRHFAV